MSPTGDGRPTVPPAAGQWPGWPTTGPPHRPLGPTDLTEIGPYRLEALLGEGGMGRVYLGRTRAGRAVAVKVVHRQYASDPAFRKRFEREVATAKRVHGLYTAPVVDADVEADEPWLATVYVPGPSLHYAVAEWGPLPVQAALRLVAGVAEALQSIHAAGVTHRDLKPSNVILAADGPTVIDFGIARAGDATSITSTDVRLGTPSYMAPEQIRAQTLTPAADVFGLGLLASFAATGRPAFGGGDGVAYRILEQEPDLDGCPEPIRSIAAACLIKDPELRPTPAKVVEMCPIPSANASTEDILATTRLPHATPPPLPADADTEPELAPVRPTASDAGPPPAYAEWVGPPTGPKARRRTKLFVLLAVVFVLLAAGVTTWIAAQSQYYVGEAADGEIAIFQGPRGSTLGIELSSQVEGSCDPDASTCDKFYVRDLRKAGRDAVRSDTQTFDDIPEARRFIQDLRQRYALPTCDSLEDDQQAPPTTTPRPPTSSEPEEETTTPPTTTRDRPSSPAPPPPEESTVTQTADPPSSLSMGSLSSGPEPEPGVNCRES